MMISRRRFLAQASAAGAAASVAMGLGMPPALANEGVITVAMAARSPNGINPQKTGLTAGDNFAIQQVYNTLVKSDDGTFATRPEDFRPSLAESWSTSEDAKTWTYVLRKGVQFHKGYGELTSADVVFTFSRHLDPEIVTNGKVYFSNLDSVEAKDSHTVKFNLKRPDPLFNGSAIVVLPANILCRKAFEEKGEGFDSDPVGTGAYQVDSVDAENGVMLSGFADHFDGAPVTKQIRVAYIADTTARTLAFAAGQVDMIEGARAPGWTDSIRQRDPETIFDMTAPGSLNTLHLNLTRAPLDDLRVRQAIRYAIDNKALASAYGDMATPMVGFIASQFSGSVTLEELPEELRYLPDVEKAKALLTEAGHPDGITISTFTSQREDYAAIMLMIQEQLRAANITLDLQIIDHAAMHAENFKDLNAMPLYSSSYPPVPTQPIIAQLTKLAEVKADGTGNRNYSHYGSALPGIDELLEQAENEPNFDRHIAIIKQIEMQVLRDLPLLGIITLSFVVARNPRVDLGFDVVSGYPYWSLNKAKMVS